MNSLLWLIIATIYIGGIIYHYPKTYYPDGNYSPSWETLLLLFWFIWFPLKYGFDFCNKIEGEE